MMQIWNRTMSMTTAMALGSAMVLGILTVAISARAGSAKPEVEHAWARASAGTTGAAYLNISNRGTEPDRLLALSTPVAEKAELHESKMDNGVMKMRPLGPITIAPGQSAVLKPGADHVMLIGLKQPLKAGQKFPLTLKFEKAGDVQVTVQVERAGAMGTDAKDHGTMPMDHGAMPMDHGAMPMDHK
jgi:copper(I)-binding protein